jgi:hypothetical protein
MVHARIESRQSPYPRSVSGSEERNNVHLPSSRWQSDATHMVTRYSFVINGATEGFSSLVTLMDISDNGLVRFVGICNSDISPSATIQMAGTRPGGLRCEEPELEGRHGVYTRRIMALAGLRLI